MRLNEADSFYMDSAKASNSLRAIFDQAVELPGSQRDEFLKTACGPDMKLRAAVESLLAAHDRAGSFLADPVIAPNLLQAREILSPNSRIDRYTLIRVLGEGGYGTVYLAEQDPPLRRRVALKVIKPGMDTKQVVARFEAERQALAMMDHPNIAKVFDAGSTNTGLPYFAMELVDGIPITKFCRSYEIDIQARLRLFISVCAAVQHAHEKGVIHRDLKPGNILVAFQDGNPMPKIIDFGIAKALLSDISSELRKSQGDEPITSEPPFLGTPQYMSPEQANNSGHKVDSRSDVYSLGALLYELLTDVPPFDQAQFKSVALEEIRRMLQEIQPPAPSKRMGFNDRRLPGNLDRIVMKAMSKDASRRYQTAGALGADVERCVDGGSIKMVGRPWRERLHLGGFHRRWRLALIALCLVGIIIIVVGMGLGFWRYHGRHAPTVPSAPTAALVTSPIASIPAVWLHFASGVTELERLDNAMMCFTNRGYKFQDLPLEIIGTTFTRRAGGRPTSVEIDASAGTTVYVLINSNIDFKRMDKLNTQLLASGWIRLADCEYGGQYPLAVYRLSTSSRQHLTLDGAGFTGFIVAARNLNLRPPAPSSSENAPTTGP